MKSRILALSLGLSASAFAAQPLVAQDLPALHEVLGVAANDVLNIRAEPSARAEITGTLPHDAKGVEVVERSEDGAWGRVNSDEATGWVSLRHLAQLAPEDPWKIPRPLRCSGTEPFWTLALDANGPHWVTPEDPATQLKLLAEKVAPQGFAMAAEEGPTRRFDLIASRQLCSDGMSDRIYGLRASLFVESADGNQLLQGCCSISQR